MSSNNRASSGVRNLRAMFENQSAANSPEPRGRSPAANATTNPADPNRPTSKVRASFFSVEGLAKDLGSTKGTPLNSPTAHRRGSFSISQEENEGLVTELKKTVSETKKARESDPFVAEPIPEQAVVEEESSDPPPPVQASPEGEMPNLGSIMKGSDFPELASKVEEPPKKEEAVEQAAVEPEPEPKSPEVKDTPAATSIDVPGDNPDKMVSGVQDSEAALKPADPKDASAISGGEALPSPTEDLSVASPPSPAESSEPKAVEEAPAVSAEPSKTKVNGTAGAAPTPKSVGKRPAPISTSKATAGHSSSGKSPMPRSPAPSRFPKTPTTPRAAPTSASTKSPAPAAKAHTKAPATKSSGSSLKPSSTSTAGTTTKAKAPAVVHKKPEAKAPAETNKKPAATKPAAPPKENTQTSPFRKPKPKSPTRPTRLPSHLLAPTAASAAKHDDHPKETLTRKSSTTSRPPAAKTIPAAAKKQPSRASIAPQPAKRPDSRASTTRGGSRAGAEDGFLARMMRPTASSAKKTHDKPASPPRRTTSVKGHTKPKSGAAGAVAKGKEVVGEAIAKVKDAVTPSSSNGVQETEPAAEPAAETETAPETPDATVEAEREATPPAQTESSEPAIMQTPNCEGETIR